jgi:hypothetical protein
VAPPPAFLERRVRLRIAAERRRQDSYGGEEVHGIAVFRIEFPGQNFARNPIK